MPATVPRLSLSTFVPPGSWCHVARVQWKPLNMRAVHTHDFAEVFWMESGRGLHLVNRRRIELAAGDIVLIRPADRHTFQAIDDQGFTFVNVAFSHAHLSPLQRRYAQHNPGKRHALAQTDQTKLWPWGRQAMPHHAHIGPDDIAHLSGLADELALHGDSRVNFDCLLLSILRAVLREATRDRNSNQPQWLHEALSRFNRPIHLQRGAAALTGLCAKSPEHVNRIVRKYLGKTTTELVNDMRLDHAARQLRMTSRTITDIAMDCGFENLGYFYRLFRQRFGITPRRYRTQQQSVVGA